MCHFRIYIGISYSIVPYPEKDVPEFKKLLVGYYEGEPLEIIGTFLWEKCWKNFYSAHKKFPSLLSLKRKIINESLNFIRFLLSFFQVLLHPFSK